MADEKGGVGTVATAMANAPLAERGERKRSLIPFELIGFKHPPKKEAFPPDDNGNVSEKVAVVLLRVRGSGFAFNASIYKVTSKANRVTYRAGMPSTGKGFPRPVFTPENDATQAAYNVWREELVTKHFVMWAKAQKSEGNAVTETAAPASGFELDI